MVPPEVGSHRPELQAYSCRLGGGGGVTPIHSIVNPYTKEGWNRYAFFRIPQ